MKTFRQKCESRRNKYTITEDAKNSVCAFITRFSNCIDFVPEMDLKLANMSHASVFVLFLPRIDMSKSSSKFEVDLYSFMNRNDRKAHVENHYLFLLIHATADFCAEDCWKCLNDGYGSFIQKYDIIFSASFEHHTNELSYIGHTFGDGDYSGCGDISAFFESLAFASLNSKTEPLIVANPQPMHIFWI